MINIINLETITVRALLLNVLSCSNKSIVTAIPNPHVCIPSISLLMSIWFQPSFQRSSHHLISLSPWDCCRACHCDGPWPGRAHGTLESCHSSTLRDVLQKLRRLTKPRAGVEGIRRNSRAVLVSPYKSMALISYQALPLVKQLGKCVCTHYIRTEILKLLVPALNKYLFLCNGMM